MRQRSARRNAGRFRLLTKCGVQGDHPPAGVWGRAPKPYAAAFFVSVASVRRREGKRVPCGHLPPEVAKRPGAHRREASAQWAVARSAKRPAGVSKYKGCARPARRTPIFAKGREARMIEQPGRPLHPALCRQTVPPQGAFFYVTFNTQFSQNRHALKRYDRYHKAAANKYA